MITTSSVYPAEEVLEPIRVTDDRNNLLGMLFDGLSDPNATPMFREPIMCAKSRPSPCGGQQCDATRLATVQQRLYLSIYVYIYLYVY